MSHYKILQLHPPVPLKIFSVWKKGDKDVLQKKEKPYSPESELEESIRTHEVLIFKSAHTHIHTHSLVPLLDWAPQMKRLVEKDFKCLSRCYIVTGKAHPTKTKRLHRSETDRQTVVTFFLAIFELSKRKLISICN